MEQHCGLGVDIGQSLHAVAQSGYRYISDLSIDYNHFPDMLSGSDLDISGSLRTIRSATRPCGRVLRNLTTKEYVREDGLSGGITLGHVALLKICWSSDPSAYVQGEESLTRGEWVGHRFDVVPLRTVEPDWIDQTQRLWDYVDKFWTCNVGEGWKERWPTKHPSSGYQIFFMMRGLPIPAALFNTLTAGAFTGPHILVVKRRAEPVNTRFLIPNHGSQLKWPLSTPQNKRC
ncbi:hypothetical protein BJX63DRAFT_416228 [Aspergillus granulosus]|uniref:Uncharacterized protein n=1 Tax=Aspergillus granulosus TaxID=176169 RepID=A0ABR4GS54_9EURO